MENASKALIIAGAILISILIVGLGVIIYQNVSEIATSGTLDSQQISSHNSPFESYFSNNASGSNVKALINQVNANNRAAQSVDEKVGNYIYLMYNDAEVKSTDIKTGKTYTINVADNNDMTDEEEAGSAYWKNGYLKTIIITLRDDA